MKPMQAAVAARKRVRVRLLSLIDVRRELAFCYRETRAGRISTQDLMRLAAALQILAGVIRAIADTPASDAEHARLIAVALQAQVAAAEAVSDTAVYVPPSTPERP